MKYSDVEKYSSLEERDKFLSEFYKNLNIENWLNIDHLQMLRFRDRIEYRRKGVKHNILGPAIEYLNKQSVNEFYIDGVKYENEEAWKPVAMRMQRDKKLSKL
jgi:hypothetical protein